MYPATQRVPAGTVPVMERITDAESADEVAWGSPEECGERVASLENVAKAHIIRRGLIWLSHTQKEELAALAVPGAACSTPLPPGGPAPGATAALSGAVDRDGRHDTKTYVVSSNRIRNVRFFKNLESEADLVKSFSTCVLSERKGELQMLPLEQLVTIRLLQRELDAWPSDSLHGYRDFMDSMEQAIFQKTTELGLQRQKAAVIDSRGQKPPGRLVSLPDSYKVVLGSEVIYIAGVAALLREARERTRHRPGVATEATSATPNEFELAVLPADSVWHLKSGGAVRLHKSINAPLAIDRINESQWWRFVFNFSSSRLRGNATPAAVTCESAPLPRQSRTATMDTRSASSTRGKRNMSLVRDRSVRAATRTLEQDGELLLDVFVQLPELIITENRPPQADVWLIQDTNWINSQTLRSSTTVSAGRGCASRSNGRLVCPLQVFRVNPDVPLRGFIRPQDATRAIRSELRGAVSRRSHSASGGDVAPRVNRRNPNGGALLSRTSAQNDPARRMPQAAPHRRFPASESVGSGKRLTMTPRLRSASAVPTVAPVRANGATDNSINRKPVPNALVANDYGSGTGPTAERRHCEPMALAPAPPDTKQAEPTGKKAKESDRRWVGDEPVSRGRSDQSCKKRQQPATIKAPEPPLANEQVAHKVDDQSLDEQIGRYHSVAGSNRSAPESGTNLVRKRLSGSNHSSAEPVRESGGVIELKLPEPPLLPFGSVCSKMTNFEAVRAGKHQDFVLPGGGSKGGPSALVSPWVDEETAVQATCSSTGVSTDGSSCVYKNVRHPELDRESDGLLSDPKIGSLESAGVLHRPAAAAAMSRSAGASAPPRVGPPEPEPYPGSGNLAATNVAPPSVVGSSGRIQLMNSSLRSRRSGREMIDSVGAPVLRAAPPDDSISNSKGEDIVPFKAPRLGRNRKEESRSRVNNDVGDHHSRSSPRVHKEYARTTPTPQWSDQSTAIFTPTERNRSSGSEINLTKSTASPKLPVQAKRVGEPAPALRHRTENDEFAACTVAPKRLPRPTQQGCSRLASPPPTSYEVSTAPARRWNDLSPGSVSKLIKTVGLSGSAEAGYMTLSYSTQHAVRKGRSAVPARTTASLEVWNNDAATSRPTTKMPLSDISSNRTRVGSFGRVRSSAVTESPGRANVCALPDLVAPRSATVVGKNCDSSPSIQQPGRRLHYANHWLHRDTVATVCRIRWRVTKYRPGRGAKRTVKPRSKPKSSPVGAVSSWLGKLCFFAQVERTVPPAISAQHGENPHAGACGGNDLNFLRTGFASNGLEFCCSKST